ncbi:ogr/Delta-like zinc finger family protein [Pseudomonas aeruginosa]|uniref:ogr/Delta-like zinc finger family protein n=1 Tax=Pseudomonas aeruginosa TaxID=287 RepID=UPI003981E0C5
MRVYCRVCNSKGKINTTRQQTNEFSKLYCSCSNPECGFRWVSHLSFSHPLDDQARPLDTLLLDHFRGMPLSKQQQLLAQLGEQAGA